VLAAVPLCCDVGSDDGLVEFVPSTPLSRILAEHRTIHKYLALTQADPQGVHQWTSGRNLNQPVHVTSSRQSHAALLFKFVDLASLCDLN
jgi:hypothetical protein